MCQITLFRNGQVLGNVGYILHNERVKIAENLDTAELS